MNVNPPRHQDPAAGDDELAKVLAGVSDDPNMKPRALADTGLQFEETPAPGSANANAPSAPAMPLSPEPSFSMPAMPAPSPEPAAAPQPAPAATPAPTPMPAPATAGPLDELKRSALEELRPLVDKLNLPAEEKFDTLLLIIRSTDDQSLLAPAHEAAKAIADESKRAEALLDIIKEIDYFGSAAQQQ